MKENENETKIPEKLKRIKKQMQQKNLLKIQKNQNNRKNKHKIGNKKQQRNQSD